MPSLPAVRELCFANGCDLFEVMEVPQEFHYAFASDNAAGICPEAWQSLLAANSGSCASYGEEAFSERAREAIRDCFEKPDAEVFFVQSGTAANALILSSLCQGYHGVVCHEFAHIATDECSAVPFFGNGLSLITAGGEGAKLNPSAIEQAITARTDVHSPKAAAVSLTQATELGRVYSPLELQGVGSLAERIGLKVHVDGARFANALAALGVSPAELSWKCGVQALSLGGTKNGMAGTEAVAFFDPDLAREFSYRMKQSGQLVSKSRYLSCQWIGMLEGGAWLRHASHANQCAQRLASELTDLPGVELLQPVDTNGVFISLPVVVKNLLHERGWHFYDFHLGSSRLMCSWATTEESINAFVADVRRALG